MKFEAAQIHFLSDVFVAVAVVVAFSLRLISTDAFLATLVNARKF